MTAMPTRRSNKICARMMIEDRLPSKTFMYTPGAATQIVCNIPASLPDMSRSLLFQLGYYWLLGQISCPHIPINTSDTSEQHGARWRGLGCLGGICLRGEVSGGKCPITKHLHTGQHTGPRGGVRKALIGLFLGMKVWLRKTDVNVWLRTRAWFAKKYL